MIESQGEPRFTALYERKDVGAFVVRAGVDEAGFKEAVASYRAKGIEPIHLDAYREAGEARFAIIWTSAATTGVIGTGFSPGAAFRAADSGQANGAAWPTS